MYFIEYCFAELQFMHMFSLNLIEYLSCALLGFQSAFASDRPIVSQSRARDFVIRIARNLQLPYKCNATMPGN